MTTRTMMTMKMKRVAAIYPSTIYGDPTMKAQQMTKRKNLIKNIQVRRPVLRRPVPVQIRPGALVRVPPDRDRDQKEIHAINRVERELDDQHDHVRARDHGLGPGIAVIVHHIIRVPDLAVGPLRPINGMRPANIVAENRRQSKCISRNAKFFL